MTKDGVTTRYYYDSNNRLTFENGSDGSLSYEYDANGNLFSKTAFLTECHEFEEGICTLCGEPEFCLSGDTTGDGIINNDDITAINSYMTGDLLLPDVLAHAADVTFDGTVDEYDVYCLEIYITSGANYYLIGEYIENLSECNIVEKFTYNARGQQTGYTDGFTTASYAYNPSGLRSSKTVDGNVKNFIYNRSFIVYEYDDVDSVTYYYGINRTHNSNGEIYVYNAHGDTVQLVENGEVTVTYVYDAFGNITEQTGNSDNPFLYCGEYLDKETGTYYLRARYYNPANGRFTQQDAWAFMDTSNPLSLNLYTYCCNNPVMYVDPSGNLTEEDVKKYKDGKITKEQFNILIDLTKRWISATTQQGKDEIHSLAQSFRDNNYEYDDLTFEATQQLADNKQLLNGEPPSKFLTSNSIFDLGFTGVAWYMLVDNNGTWDYKRKPASWMPTDKNYFMFNDSLITFADFGNINYGYTGTVLGLDDVTLYQAAGYVQTGKVTNNASSFYGDTEHDFYNVTYGIRIARGEGYYGVLKLPVSTMFTVKEILGGN